MLKCMYLILVIDATSSNDIQHTAWTWVPMASNPKPGDIKAPTSVSELRSFLGVCNYSQFIEDYEEIAWPLTELLRKDKPFEWVELQDQSFCQMKEKLCFAPC